MDAQTMRFPSTFGTVRPGDLVFFSSNFSSSTAVENHGSAKGLTRAAVISSSVIPGSSVFHVALVTCSMPNGEIEVVHADDKRGVVLATLSDVIEDMRPDLVEIATLDVNNDWKIAATKWARDQLGAAYNDIFSPNCINSDGERSFYCCQLVAEAYKEASTDKKHPFLPHTLNFLDSEGKLIPYWTEYYKIRCPNSPDPPQGQPGSQPSKLRISPIVKILVSKTIYNSNGIAGNGEDSAMGMKKFHIPHDLTKTLHFVNGACFNFISAKTEPFKVIEPRNGQLLAECYPMDKNKLEEVASFAAKAQKEWAKTSWSDRRQIFIRAGTLIRKHIDEISQWEVRDNGKSITEAKVDILLCADTFEYYASLPISGEYIPYSEATNRFAYTRREPYGVVGGIGAWNFPFQTATWKICPAIVAGNAIIYKPSPLAPITSVLLASILQCAGVPDGIVNIVQGGAETGQAICESTQIKKVSFTGSVQTGKTVAGKCAAVNVKPVTLELGGKSPCIFLEDADVEMTVNGALFANFLTQGEVCSNASKLLVHKKILKEFTAKLIIKTQELRIGDPLNDATHIGALISLEHLEKVSKFIKDAVNDGATILTGGERVYVKDLEDGFYMSPCILTNITPSMRVYSEEIFGPVALIIPFDTDEEALRIANDTQFGLAAGVFTKDLSKAHNFAASLESGMVYINMYNDTDPAIPFGGYKQSGYGRENGKAALDSYLQEKAVWVNTSGRLDNPFPIKEI